MKGKAAVVVAVVTVLGVVGARGQSPVITSFQGNGQVTWTNAANTSAVYHIEWAASLNGPWYRSFQNLKYIEAQSNTTFTVDVPMFYRVVMATNPPPAGMELIEAGAYQMGYPDTNPSGDAKRITISAFYMDRHLVTKTMWDQVRDWGLTNGYSDIAIGQAGSSGSSTSSNHPVTMITWYDCVKWCNARSEKEGLAPAYYIDPFFFNVYRTGTSDVANSWVNWNSNGYRLPTESEWEKAARGGLVNKMFPWGDMIDGSMANFANSGDSFDNGTTPVGYYNGSQMPTGKDMANGYGLYDMAGNVWQRCWDWRITDVAPVDGSVDPKGPDYQPGVSRGARGGPWLNGSESQFARTGFRGGFVTGQPANAVGFRCARGL